MRLQYFGIVLVALTLVTPAIVLAEGVGGTPRFIATYFYTNIRCPSCITIQKLTEKTITTEFRDQLDSKLLQWRTINIDGAGNFHYVKDYNMYTKSVIISEMADGKEIRWKNLRKVWELLRDEEKFGQYLKDEITAFMARE